MSKFNKNGEDFIRLLEEFQCPDVNGLQGKDVDWLWETKAAPFMEWMCRNLSSENVLSEEESKRWSTFPKDEILTGDQLKQTLRQMKEEDEIRNEMEDLEEIRDEINVKEVHVSELDVVKNQLSREQARISLLINSYETKLNKSDAEILGQQQKILHLKNEVNESLDVLKTTVHKSLTCDASKAQSLSEVNMSNLFLENDHARKLICDLIHSKFSSDSGSSKPNAAIESELIRGQEVEEFEDLISEIERLRFSLQDSEEKRILHVASCQASKEGLDETKSMIKLLINDMLPRNSQVLENEIKKLESDLKNLQAKCKTTVKDSLRPVIEQKITKNCSKFLAEDLQIKIEKQKLVSSHLKTILDLLLDLTSCQEVLGAALTRENEAVNQLETTLEQIKKLQLEAKSDHDKTMECALKIKEKETQIKRNTLMPWDKTLLILHKFLTMKDLDPSMITYDDLKHLLEKLYKTCETNERALNSENLNWQQTRNQIRVLLQQILSGIGITDKSKQCELASSESRKEIKSAQTEVLKFSHNVRDAIGEWDKARKSIVENPAIEMEKKIWKDFMNGNFEKMERVIESISANANKRKM